ncbi:glyoxalase family protein [Gracilibacillus orientalis]|uniref:Glyoxalase family protein n=1 Tax=Gracilibacillus orientalis TaxID=334253 RepID=A0A1I4JJZ6_9BACI|nr:ring-cleaving dioxygenase [Gracilibacillus orientalis]SFL66870.1 glyoxalase family protein [Gracilibacillus orientalis]
MELKGIHHVSAITATAKDNYYFYTNILGMRLVKKTVNQDDPSMYHLFYADEIGRAGTDLTFFEITNAGHTYAGNNSISCTSLRVPCDEALSYWEERLDEYDVVHDGIGETFGRKVLPFQDHEGQRLVFVSDENNKGVAAGVPWSKSPVPKDYGITGLGPVRLTVPELAPTERILTEVLGFRHAGFYPNPEGETDMQVFETGAGGTGAEVHMEVLPVLQKERPGRGSVHHVAFRVADYQELEKWHERITEEKLPNSGLVDRYYFQSLYFREPNGILFELATDGPGFNTDEKNERLGETLALPPFLEQKRNEIEANLQSVEDK